MCCDTFAALNNLPDLQFSWVKNIKKKQKLIHFDSEHGRLARYLRAEHFKNDINSTENIYNGSLEVVEKIDPTSLRLDPLYIKVR